MLVSLIAALTDDHVIGIDNRLPWKLPADMRWFRRHTLGKTVIMGRKTFESLGCRPLPERRNVVVTSDRGFTAEGAEVVHDIDAALAALGPGEEELMVIGGASFYEQMLPRARRLYLTYVHADIEGDAWFPRFDAPQWREVQREDHAADEKNPYPYSFVILERR
ncbi:MAG: type 3 dihydrofolate reductase [Gammaproteobacteria bacterium]